MCSIEVVPAWSSPIAHWAPEILAAIELEHGEEATAADDLSRRERSVPKSADGNTETPNSSCVTEVSTAAEGTTEPRQQAQPSDKVVQELGSDAMVSKTKDGGSGVSEGSVDVS